MRDHPLKDQQQEPRKYIILRQNALDENHNPVVITFDDHVRPRRFIGTKEEAVALHEKMVGLFPQYHYFIIKVKV